MSPKFLLKMVCPGRDLRDQDIF